MTLDDFEFLDDMKRAIFASERVDCTSSASVAMAMKDIFKVYGRCDAVFMCVGKGCPHPLVETSDETMEDVVKSNVFSAFYVAKHYAAQLKTAASNKSRRRRRRKRRSVAVGNERFSFSRGGSRRRRRRGGCERATRRRRGRRRVPAGVRRLPLGRFLGASRFEVARIESVRDRLRVFRVPPPRRRQRRRRDGLNPPCSLSPFAS